MCRVLAKGNRSVEHHSMGKGRPPGALGVSRLCLCRTSVKDDGGEDNGTYSDPRVVPSEVIFVDGLS